MNLSLRHAPAAAPVVAPALLLGQDADIRPPVAVDFDGIETYHFPATGREQMIADILGRPLMIQRDGLFLAWDIRMNFPWNRTGRVPGGEEVQTCHEARWRSRIETDGEIFRTACDQALQPWLRAPVQLLDEPDLTCDFDLAEPAHGHLVLLSFNRASMRFDGRRGFENHVMTLENLDLGLLWTACRTLDADLSCRMRAEAMAIEYNRIRAGLEAEWDCAVEDLSFPG